MTNANPLIGHDRQPQPPQIVLGAPGVGKTYSVPDTTENETTGKEDESRE